MKVCTKTEVQGCVGGSLSLLVLLLFLIDLNRHLHKCDIPKERAPISLHAEDQICDRCLLPWPSWRLGLLPFTHHQLLTFGTTMHFLCVPHGHFSVC